MYEKAAFVVCKITLRCSFFFWKTQKPGKNENKSGVILKECRRYWKTLKNEYLDAKIGLDTAENEPSKVWLKIRGRRFDIESYSDFFSQNVQTLEGSFSAVSTPIFTTKASFCSIFRDLQDLQSCAPLRSQNYSKIRQVFPYSCSNFCKHRYFSTLSIEFCTELDEIFSE